jgi:hypothetical protein
VTVSPLPVLELLAEADAETLQPPVVDLETLASVVAAALLPAVGMTVSSAETGKAGYKTSPRHKAATGAAYHNKPAVALLVPPHRDFLSEIPFIVRTPVRP